MPAGYDAAARFGRGGVGVTVTLSGPLDGGVSYPYYYATAHLPIRCRLPVSTDRLMLPGGTWRPQPAGVERELPSSSSAARRLR